MAKHNDPINPSEHIDQLIESITDWRSKTLASLRKCILNADGEIIEEWKWMGSPVCNGHREKVKLTLGHGASRADPDKRFNAGRGGKVWRAIDVFEGDKINARALKTLVRAAIDYNQTKKKKKASTAAWAKADKSSR